jgi:hypothetical protein
MGLMGVAAAIAFGFPFVKNVLTVVPRSRVANCKAVVSHTYFLHITLESGKTLVLQQEDVPDPAACLAPGTVLEKVRGELGYRIDGRLFFWESQGHRTFAVVAFAGLLAAFGALVMVLREKCAERK